ncbi:unnamed protein product, partial [Rhizoctonia solani]
MRTWLTTNNRHLASFSLSALTQAGLPKMKSQPQLISCQCYISLIRLLSVSYVLGYWASEVKFDPVVRPLSAHSVSGFVFGAMLFLNDVFMLMADRRRTDTYIGCVITQLVVNCCFSGLVALHVVLDAQWRFFLYFNYYGYSMAAAFEIFALIVGLCSLGLLGISLWPIFAFRSYIPVRQLWKTNTKDAFKGIMILPDARPCTLSVFGHPRGKTIPFPRLHIIVGLAIGRFIKMYLARFFFRRIRPVETRVYAFCRNSFAIVAIGILIFRTIVAIQRAQTEIDTRVTSRTCNDASPIHDISILVDRLVYDSYFGISFPVVNVSVARVWPISIPDDPKNDGGYNVNTIDNSDFLSFLVVWLEVPLNCSSTFLSSFTAVESDEMYQNRTLVLFNCTFPGDTPELYSNAFQYYRINVQPIAVPFQTGVLIAPAPRIWLLNMKELSQPIDSNRSEVGQVRMYLPPLELLNGFQITAKAHLVTRRFLKSSIVKDIIFNFKSKYKRLSLYPI